MEHLKPVVVKKESASHKRNRKKKEKLKRQSKHSEQLKEQIEALKKELNKLQEGTKVRNFNEPFLKPIPDMWGHLTRSLPDYDNKAEAFRESLTKSVPIESPKVKHKEPLSETKEEEISPVVIQEKETPVKEIQNKETPVKEIQDKETPVKEIQDKETPVKEIQEKESPINEIQEKETPIKEIQERESPVKEIQERESPVKEIQEKEISINEIQEEISINEIQEETPLKEIKVNGSKVQLTRSIDISDNDPIDRIWKISYSEFEIDELVSEGSGGNLYLGYWFSVPVAIKKLKLEGTNLNEADRKQIENEYKMLKEVNHPYIVQFLGLCNHVSGIYLLFEYVEQGDLFDLLMFSNKKLTWLECMRIAFQVAQACFYLHSRKIIHRDIKSPNVLIGHDYRIKLCDLGLATFFNNPKFREETSRAGTDQWMAPEIFLGKDYDEKVDVFSFGIVVIELITKKPPSNRTAETNFEFDKETFLDQISDDCPDDFIRLALKCTSSDPKLRPAFKDIVSLIKLLFSELQESTNNNNNSNEEEHEE